jgi:hypothetical protein
MCDRIKDGEFRLLELTGRRWLQRCSENGVWTHGRGGASSVARAQFEEEMVAWGKSNGVHTKGGGGQQ